MRAIPLNYHRLIRSTIHEQLAFTPDRETRNRKPLEPPSPYSAAWELRFGPRNRFRVLYDIQAEEGRVVILAIGVKEGNRLIIDRQEFEL